MEITTTLYPQNYTAVNFRESAQYFDSAGKTFVVWWLKSESAILFTHVAFANHSHSRRLNTREHFWIYGIYHTHLRGKIFEG